MRAIEPPLQRGQLKHASQIIDHVSTPRAEREMLSTLSLHVLAPQLVVNMIMLLA